MLRIGRRHETIFSVTCDVSAARQAPGEGGHPGGARWYERQRPRLGRAFLHQIDVLLGRIREDPLQHHRSFTAAFAEPSHAGSPTAFSTVSTDRLFSCLRWCICIATPPHEEGQ